MKRRDFLSTKRIGLWAGAVILVLALGIGAMQGSTFASIPSHPEHQYGANSLSLPPSGIPPKRKVDQANNDAATIATPTSTPTPCGPMATPVLTSLVGHVTWQGSTQPDPKQVQPLTLTLFMSGPVISRVDSPNLTTSASGVFTMSVSTLYPGTYQWRVKGRRSLANSGSLVLPPNGSAVEMGLMRVGDANDDNVVNAGDFNILKGQFGQSGSNLAADFNNDGAVGAQDFNLLKGNFGQSGSPDLCPMCPSGPSVSELFGSANPVEGRTFKGWFVAESDPDGNIVPATGNVAESHTDLSISGRGPSMGFARTYNSLASNILGPMGFGWTDNYNMYVEGAANAVVHQENGSTAPFVGSGSPGSSYTHDPRVLAELSRSLDGTYVFTHTQDLTRYTFNAQGKLTEIRDRNNYATTLAYNGNGQLQTVTDPVGRSLAFTYGCGLLLSVTGPGPDPGGQTVTFTYGPDGNLSSATDVAGNMIQYEYDAQRRMLERRDALLANTNYAYDSLGRVVSATSAMSRTTQFAYTTSFPNNVATITDPRGNITKDTYLSNRLVSVIESTGTAQQATWQFAWGGGYVSGLASMTDANNHTWSNTWDAKGNKLTSTDPLSRTTRYAYNTTNDLLVVTDTLGITNTYTYDSGGNPLSMSRPLTQTNQLALTTYTYDAAHPGDMVSMTDPLGRTSTYTYDAYGYPASSTDPLTHTTILTNDILGRVLSTTSPRGSTNAFAYDPYGDVTVITDSRGYTTTYTYDPNRNVVSARDANDHVTTYDYNPDHELIQETRPDSTHSNMAYDNASNVISQTNGLGQTTTYSFDSFNRPTTTTDALGRATTYNYDLAGRLTGITDAEGRTTTYGYDATDERTSTSYSDGTTHNVTYTYDSEGRRTQMTDGTGTTSYNYDSLHRLRRSQNGADKIVKYSYDLNNNLTQLVYPSNSMTVTYGYDPADRLTSVNDGLGHTTQYGYDPDNDPTDITYPNGVAAAIGYDANGDVASINHSASGTNILSLTYERTGKGLLSLANESGAGISGVEPHSYNHDGLDRLLGDQLNSPTTFSNRTWTYNGGYEIPQSGYESSSAPPSMVNRTHDAANELTHLAETRGPVIARDQTFLYNPDGDRIQQIDNLAGSAINYTYDQADRLTDYNGVAQYAYNGDGLRMSKTQSGSTTEQFTWAVQPRANGSIVMVDQTGTEVTRYVYGLGGTPLEQVATDGQVYFYHTDQLGSVRALTDGSGAVVNTYTYEPYGAVTASTGTVSNPFGYAGEYTDSESGFSHMMSRYYDPATQQFLTVDPLVANTEQAYAYAGDDPLNATGSSGNSGRIKENGQWWAGRTPTTDPHRRRDSGVLGGEPDIVWNDVGSLTLTASDLTQPGGGAAGRAVPGRLKWQVINLKRGITSSMDAWSRKRGITSSMGREMIEDGSVESAKLKWQTITLKRGITSSMDAWKWRKAVLDGKVDQARAVGPVDVVGEDGTPEGRYTFKRAWPHKISGPSLN